MTVRITIDAGTITLTGTVDTVDFAALRGDVVAHDHGIPARSSVRSENIQGQNDDGTNFRTYDGSTSRTEAIYIDNGTGLREHSHAVDMTQDGTTATTALSPSGDDTEIDSGGNVTCDTIDGYAPEVVYDQYDGHTHGLTGTGLSNETLGPHSMKRTGGGNNIQCWHGYFVDAAFYNYWDTAHTASGAHNHSRNTLGLAAYEDGPTPPFGDNAQDFEADGASGNIKTGGRVNGIGIKQFKDDFDAHEHESSGLSGEHAATSSYIRDSAGNVRYMYTGSAWRWGCWIRAAAHRHTITSGAPE